MHFSHSIIDVGNVSTICKNIVFNVEESIDLKYLCE